MLSELSGSPRQCSWFPHGRRDFTVIHMVLVLSEHGEGSLVLSKALESRNQILLEQAEDIAWCLASVEDFFFFGIRKGSVEDLVMLFFFFFLHFHETSVFPRYMNQLVIE